MSELNQKEVNEQMYLFAKQWIDNMTFEESKKVPVMAIAYCLARLSKQDELLKEQETKAGTWQWKIHGKAESGGTLGEAVCDQCGKSTYATAVKGDLNYCPNCGAKMED